MVDIFISHARGDLPRVQPIIEALEALGLTLFINLDGADGDAASVAQTDAALRSAKAVLCFWSPRYFFFGWCVTECRAALGRDAMVAVRLRAYEPSTPPEDLRGHAPFDLADWAGEADHWGWRATLAALSERVGRDLTAPAAPARDAGPLGGFAAIDTVFDQERSRMASAAERVAKIFAEAPGHIFRDPLKDGGEGPALCVIPAGRFQMGSPEDEPGRSPSDGPLRQVILRQPFALGRLAVTFEEYDAFCAATGRAPPPDCGWGRGKRPVINVSWADAQAYCAWLGKQAQAPYRLPS
ncbi:MAG: SUMF1/EgtB/PvdO family nonheme iron enzyme, partial [Pseudomonadota bacterium]